MSIESVYGFTMGFTQTVGRQTGVADLWLTTRRLASRTVWVLPPLPWDMNAKQWALFIDRVLRDDNGRQIHAEIRWDGYSYGGFAALQMCRHLDSLGRTVEHLVLCDAVARLCSAKLLWTARIWSMLPFARLRVPGNVKRVTALRQEQNHPRGHDIECESPRTYLETRWVEQPHHLIDDSVEHLLAWREALSLALPGAPSTATLTPTAAVSP